MKVEVLYFASLREALGRSRETVDTQARTADELRAELCARGGAWAERLAVGRNVRVALDHSITDGSAALSDGAEVAFFPPVTGG